MGIENVKVKYSFGINVSLEKILKSLIDCFEQCSKPKRNVEEYFKDYFNFEKILTKLENGLEYYKKIKNNNKLKKKEISEKRKEIIKILVESPNYVITTNDIVQKITRVPLILKEGSKSKNSKGNDKEQKLEGWFKELENTFKIKIPENDYDDFLNNKLDKLLTESLNISSKFNKINGAKLQKITNDLYKIEKLKN